MGDHAKLDTTCCRCTNILHHIDDETLNRFTNTLLVFDTQFNDRSYYRRKSIALVDLF